MLRAQNCPLFHNREPECRKPKVDCQVCGLSPAVVTADNNPGMNRGLYTAATGMSAAQRMLDTTANNLANVSTNAFKRDGLVFRDALEANLNSRGQAIGQMSYGVKPDGEFTDFEMGSITETGNNLDFAITDSKGAFKVDTGNGQFRYTRDGAFRLNDQKQLVDRQGHLVMDRSDSPITLEGQEIAVQRNGEIFVDGAPAATIGVFDGTFVKQGHNLFVSSDAKLDEAIGVQGKAIEGSNVNAVEAMVQMIAVSRSFDLAQKSVQQHDELTQRLIQSMNGQ
jgi:flagellar basal body rod protein FlgG